PEEIMARMAGKSMPDSARVGYSDLRYLRLLHYDIQGRILKGEMVTSALIADDVAEIFHELFKSKYPIQRIRLIDDYDAVDEMSMRDNNSSSFCYRVISGTTRLSYHARGLAVDINTLYNPYFKIQTNEQGDSVGYYALEPATAVPFVDRSQDFVYKIDGDDLAVKLFKAKGFVWGGDWTDRKDYQHFEKRID
ncbi:MAG: M15 family metallopeptidase, partial [Bacteroidales bacterium]|nr:M15 family metallopeptidase [Bacteroidales bacterium]